MLLPIAGLVVIAKPLTGILRIRCGPGDGIEFVITQYAARGANRLHAPNEFHGLHLIGPAINEIADEDGSAPGMFPGVLMRLVA